MTQTTTVTKREATPSERFALTVEKQYGSEVGTLHMTEYDKTLAQHLFVKVDAAMAEMNARKGPNDTLITWNTIDMRQLAMDAVHRVQLGIDGLIPGHLYPIAYLNHKTGKYVIDLRVGYKGELYYKQKASLKPIRDIRVELVYSTDEFIVYKKGASCDIEGYDFHIRNPFDRGEMVGGFGYIAYENEADNVLVILSKAEIERYRSSSKAANGNFWRDWYEQMAYKTIVHRLMDKITLDPSKINIAAMTRVEAEAAQPEAAPAVLDDAPLTIEAEDAAYPPVKAAEPVNAAEEPF